jgi:hypothetical protein
MKHIYCATYTIYRHISFLGFEWLIVNGSIVNHIECDGVMSPQILEGLNKASFVGPHRKTVLNSVTFLGMGEGGDISSWSY